MFYVTVEIMIIKVNIRLLGKIGYCIDLLFLLVIV